MIKINTYNIMNSTQRGGYIYNNRKKRQQRKSKKNSVSKINLKGGAKRRYRVKSRYIRRTKRKKRYI
jgi:hypothetical protein